MIFPVWMEARQFPLTVWMMIIVIVSMALMSQVCIYLWVIYMIFNILISHTTVVLFIVVIIKSNKEAYFTVILLPCNHGNTSMFPCVSTCWFGPTILYYLQERPFKHYPMAQVVIYVIVIAWDRVQYISIL